MSVQGGYGKEIDVSAALGGGSIEPPAAGMAFTMYGDLIPWSDGLSVGHAEMDSQHKALFATVNRLHKMRATNPTLAEVQREASMLQVLLTQHFADEEKVLEEAGYPHVAAHREEHQELLRQLDGLQLNLLGTRGWGKDSDFAWMLVSFLLSVSVGHIYKADFEYRDYLAKPAA